MNTDRYFGLVWRRSGEGDFKHKALHFQPDVYDVKYDLILTGTFRMVEAHLVCNHVTERVKGEPAMYKGFGNILISVTNRPC